MIRLPDDIVIMTMSRWDGEVSSAVLSLARELAQERRVWYLDHPISYKDLFSGWNSPAISNRRKDLLASKVRAYAVPGMPDGFRAVSMPVTWPVNFLAHGPLYEAGSRRNDALLNRALGSLVAENGIENYLFLNSFDPFFFRRLTLTPKPVLRIYQSRDDISQERYIARHGIRLEREQLDAADLRLGTSTGLCAKLSRPDKPVAYLPNGADAVLFNRALLPGDCPADMPNNGKPIVGYVGNMAALRMDYALLDAVVAACPDFDFVFVGTGQRPDSAFARSANVYFTGPKPLQALPDYLRPMAATLIPFSCNTLTKSIYPLKLNEYLAAGKPVVCTAFSEDVEAFSDIVAISRQHSDFVPLLRHAMAEDSPERQQRRVQRAADNAWPLRANRFLALCRETMEHQNASPCPLPNA